LTNSAKKERIQASDLRGFENLEGLLKRTFLRMIMFYTGITVTANATLVIAEKRLKNVQKHYHLKAVKRFPSDDAEIEKEIGNIFNDRKFIVKKRVFSQNRRPAKNVRANPVIVMEFKQEDKQRIDKLREKRIPVEGISQCNETEWRKEDYGPIALGNNYYIPDGDCLKNLLTVFQQGRLIIDTDDVSTAKGLTDELNTVLNPDELLNTHHSDIFSALSLPVWFCETIRIIRRY
jgi:hypothetical protein